MPSKTSYLFTLPPHQPVELRLPPLCEQHPPHARKVVYRLAEERGLVPLAFLLPLPGAIDAPPDEESVEGVLDPLDIAACPLGEVERAHTGAVLGAHLGLVGQELDPKGGVVVEGLVLFTVAAVGETNLDPQGLLPGFVLPHRIDVHHGLGATGEAWGWLL